MLKSSGSGTHKWKLWAGFIAALFIIWFAGWYFMARYGEGIVDEQIARQSSRGIDITCNNRAIRGFPFRAGLFCDNVKIEDRQRGLNIEAGALRSTGLLIKPDQAIIELDAPLFVTEGVGLPTAFHWTALRASVRGSLDGLERLSATISDLEVQFPLRFGGLLDGIEVKSGEFHLRPTPKSKGGDLDLAFSINAGKTVPRFIPGEISASADIRISNNFRRYLPDPLRINNAAPGKVVGQIRALDFSLSTGGKIRLSGPFTIDRDGLLSGRIQLAIAGLDEVGKTIAQINPQWTELLAPVLAIAARIGKKSTIDTNPAREVTLKIRQGVVTLGIIQIGVIPSLQP